MMKRISIVALAALVSLQAAAQNKPFSKGGADEQTPSKSEYFSWIEHTWEGPTEKQALADLNFFKYLKDTYGMQLDIFAFDAGTIDGRNGYGYYKSGRTARHFPNGFGLVAELSRSMGTGLGMWAGPDGFGDTPEEARKRSDMYIDMVRNYNFRLMKLDACCGPLRPSKFREFNAMMDTIRTIVPDFVVLNHRLDLGEGTAHSTTYLLGGAETYVDVHMQNYCTAPHHRAGNLARENTPGLTRLSEDHGVCLSSFLDAWDDDLILQAFCRNLILAPEIYGSPWFLREDELSYLAYIFNLHRDYNSILVNGMELPQEQYGLNSVSRGDGNTRFITLRNLSWNTRSFTVDLDSSIGLTDNGRKVKARLYHPCIEDKGDFKYGGSVEVTVEPFRVALIKLTNMPETDNILISGVPYRIVNDRAGNDWTVKLLGEPGKEYDVRITRGKASRKHFKFIPEGEALKHSANRCITTLEPCDIPADMESIYYASVYSASNDCLEAQALRRSGPTSVPEQQAARDGFLNQFIYLNREVDSRFAFDGNPRTAYSLNQRNPQVSPWDVPFLVDLGSVRKVDSLTFDTFDWYSLQPYSYEEGAFFYVSEDLSKWTQLPFTPALHTVMDCSGAGAFRYVRLGNSPLRVSEFNAYQDGKALDRSGWTANNSFYPYNYLHPHAAWTGSFTLDEIPEGAYLCIAVNGHTGTDGVYAGFRIDGKPVGCPDRAPAYVCNAWESAVRKVDGNYTFYLPLTPEMKDSVFEPVVLSVADGEDCRDLDIKVYMSQYPWDKGGKTIGIKSL